MSFIRFGVLLSLSACTTLAANSADDVAELQKFDSPPALPDGDDNDSNNPSGCANDARPPVPSTGLCQCAFADCQSTQINCTCDLSCYGTSTPAGCAFASAADGSSAAVGPLGDYVANNCAGSASTSCREEDDLRQYQECSIADCQVLVVEPVEDPVDPVVDPVIDPPVVVAPPPTPSGEPVCYKGVCDPEAGEIDLAKVVTWEAVDASSNLLCARSTLHVDVADNTYGVNSDPGWNKPHTFQQIYKSDHLAIELRDAQGALLCGVQVDLLSADSTAASGWGSLGISGGDGAILDCPSGAVVSATSSMDYNFNTLGCVDLESSPDPGTCSGWQNAYWFEVCYDRAVLGLAADAAVQFAFPYVHASPAKCTTGDTLQVTPGPCEE